MGGTQPCAALPVSLTCSQWSAAGSSGGVPWVWKDSMVFRPHACPLARSAWVHVIRGQSGARTRRVSGLHNSMRLPPGS